MAEYEVQIDIVMSGSFYVEAESEKEARSKVISKYYVPSDLKNFHEVAKEITDVYTTETKTFSEVWGL